MNMKKLPIGVSDFKKIIEQDYYYVDKSLFIKEIIDSGDTILLIPRPRRFGKTLNLSMLGYFYTCCPVTWSPDAELPVPTQGKHGPQSQNNYAYLFNGLAISQAGQKYLDKMSHYPVIFFSFRNIKDPNWESCLDSLKKLIQDEYLKHDYLLESPRLKPAEKKYFKMIIDFKGSTSDYTKSLDRLLVFLTRFYGKRAVILIDEYDAPALTGFTHDYYEDVINFMRIFMSGGLKDTDQYLEKAIITGIMRITRESIFSGLNNPGVYTVLSKEFSQHFGFTEIEVRAMLEDFQVLHMLDQVQLWYNGYCFGGTVMYNPWSIINFLRSDEKKFKPYWINTSDNQLVDYLLSKGGKELHKELEQLIRGETIEKAIDENIVLKDVSLREDALWGFLLMGGYLKQTDERWDTAIKRFIYKLSVPNEEVMVTYTNIIANYFSTKIENKTLETMLKALIEGDIKLFEKMLKQIVLAVFSYHDFGNSPEKVYHALVAGLLIWITNTHEVRSNRESGYGRYDILIIPKDISKIGYVIEFKTVDKDDNETVAAALETALAQIEANKYETELQERGITRIKKLAIAFLGKDVFIKAK